MLARRNRRPVVVPPYLRREAERQLHEIQEAVARVVGSGRFLFGDELSAFESEFAESVELPEAVGVGSGTSAIHIALRALDIGPGDEVITQSHSSPFTAIAIGLTGARTILVDSCDDDFGMSPAAFERALTSATRAVVPVHLYGQPVRLEEIMELAAAANVAVVEDCAQAHGATLGGQQVGTFGTFGCFSFYPTKNLGALGDAGAVVTKDADLAERVRRLRNGGMVAPGLHAECGVPSRQSEIQAAILRIRLPHLPASNAARRSHVASYEAGLRGVVLPRMRNGTCWAPHQYVIRHPQREHIRSALARQGIPLQVHYARPIHLQEGFRMLGAPRRPLPVAENLASEVLSLPTHPNMTGLERDKIVELVNEAAQSAETR